MKGFRNKIRALLAGALVLVLLTGALPAYAASFSAIVTSKTTLYRDAALTEVAGTLKANTVVRITGYSSTIARISYQAETCYVRISDLKRVEDVAVKVITNAAGPVYQSPDTESLSASVRAGTRLYMLAKQGQWACVEKGGAVGYMNIALLEEADDNWQVGVAIPTDGATISPQATAQSGITVRTYTAVTTQETKIYKSAALKAKVLATLPADTQLTVRATSSGGWACVEVNGKLGFCLTSDLKESVGVQITAAPEATATPVPDGAVPGVVNVDELVVYQSADAQSAKLGTLKQGARVNVLKWNSQWAYIELNGNLGFCAVAGLTRADAQATAAPTPVPGEANAQRGTVTASSLAVYQTAGTNGTKLGTLKKGQAVNVIQTSDGWAFIELNGNYGFCLASGITIDKAQDTIPAGFKSADFTATVVLPETRAYAARDTGAESVQLKLGAQVQVIGYNATWACIKQGGNIGFVSVKALSRTHYDAIDSDGTALQTLLKALLSGGYYDSVPSTSYNAAAIAAIKRFQSACGLEQTGVADENMLRIVYSGNAPVSSLLYSSFSSGDKGDDVGRVQARLYALGYLSKSASLTGTFDSTTVSAVKLFQNANQLDATGKADPATLKALYSTGANKLPTGVKAADASKSSSGGSSSSTYLNSVPDGLASTTYSYSSGMSNAEKLEYAIYLAQSKLGCPYVYGASGPSKFDCSGLTSWIMEAVGVKLKRTAYSQGYDDTYQKIEGWKNLKRGDLVYFNTISDSDLSDHAGVYLGDGYFIHASSGAHKVVVSNLSTGFYGRVFSWGRRILA